MVGRVAFALLVAAATVLTPIGGLPQARADLLDLPDETWGVVDVGRSITSLIPSEVMAIEQVGNTIYAGGQFTTVVRRRSIDPEFAQPFLAAFDATTGDWIDWWTPEFNGPVFSLEAAADGSRLYVGGEFTEVNGHPGTAGLVALDPASGRIDHTWTPNLENAFVDDPAAVRSLTESDGWLYVGGTFTHITGNNPSSRKYHWNVGRVSLADATPDSSWRPVVKGGSVWGLDHDPVRDRIYLAGYFETVNSVTPSDNFAVVTDTDGSTITTLQRFPELTPNQDHQFEVIAHGDFVWVAGTQHVVYMLNASDLSINRRWFTGFEDGFQIGGDFQAIGILGDVMYATCHCWGVVRELPNWVTTLAEARDIQPLTDEVQGIMGFDLATGDYITGWAPDIFGSIAGWAVHGGGDGCLWAGGDFNRRTVGDTWRNGLIRWCDDAGQGPPVGPPLTQQPPPETNPPTAPASLTATDVGDGTVDLAWTAASDDTAVTYYRVYRNGTPMRATQALTLTDLAATPGDAYTVRAADPYDNESGDSPSATPNLGGHLEPVLTASFDGNDGGFVYSDDVFSGTSEPDYSDPLLRRDGGVPEGNIMVLVGGKDDQDLGPFSGAWEKDFTLAAAGDVELSLMYKLSVKNALENGEFGEARAAIDGNQLGGSGYLAHIAGGGDSGWLSFTTTVSLGAGTHTLSLGGYQNSKTNINEWSEISFDAVSITPLAPTVGFTAPVPGTEITGVTAFELRASSIEDPSAALTVDVSTDGGNNWSAAPWNPVTERFDFSHDVSTEAEGSFTLQARVTDTSARVGTGSATYVVNNDDDPTITITNPPNGANVTGIVAIRMDASDPNDPVGSLTVATSTDGGAVWNLASWTGTEYEYLWDTALTGDGPVTIEARVTDAAGTTVFATPVNVTVGSPFGYDDAVLSDGPVAYWRLGESAGTTAVDETGGNDGIYVGSPALGATGLIASSNSAVTFDGVDDIVPILDAAELNTGVVYETKTIELWFNSNNITDRQVLYEQGATARGLNVYVHNGSVWAGAWNRTSNAGDSTTPWADDVFTSVAIVPGVTYHLAAVFDFPTDTFSLYLNGALVDSASGLGRLYGHGGNIGLGAMNDSARFADWGRDGGDNYFFDGVIDEVATYNTALSQAAIVNHYTIGGPQADYAATVAADGATVYWRLGDAAGTVAADLFGGDDATYVGSPTLGVPGVILDTDTAVGFDGIDDIVEVPDSSAINTGGPYTTRTVELWFNANNVTDRQVLWEQGATARGISIYLLNGNLYAGAWNIPADADPSTPWAAPVFVSTPVSTSTVYHVAFVFDQPNDTLALYVNGSLADSSGGLGLLFGHGGDVGIGAMNDSALFHDKGDGGGNKHFFDGVIDEVALYPTALSAATIANHHTVGLL